MMDRALTDLLVVPNRYKDSAADALSDKLGQLKLPGLRIAVCDGEETRENLDIIRREDRLHHEEISPAGLARLSDSGCHDLSAIIVRSTVPFAAPEERSLTEETSAEIAAVAASFDGFHLTRLSAVVPKVTPRAEIEEKAPRKGRGPISHSNT